MWYFMTQGSSLSLATLGYKTQLLRSKCTSFEANAVGFERYSDTSDLCFEPA